MSDQATMPYLGHMTAATDAARVPQWTIADRLRKARDHAGLSQLELADAIGVSRNSISSYETGAIQPRRIVLNAWSLTTGVPLTWILTGETPSGDGCAIRDSNPEPADLWPDEDAPCGHPSDVSAYHTKEWYVTVWPARADAA